jgi:protein-disulfide isomerase
MEKNNQDVGRWVDERLAALDGFADWQPSASRAFSALRWRQRVRRAGWVSATAATVAAGFVLLAISGPKACANPVECANEAAQGAVPQKAPAAARNFKESGSPTATVTLEVYTDYQCPSCAIAYATTIPEFVAMYVKTGKVKLLHRDFPLPQHQYARLAARYANAAGRLGYYDAAVEQIFKTQPVWEKDGAIDKQLVAVLPPGVLQKVREAAQSDPSLDQSINADMTMGGKDLINQTPSVVIVAKGKRQVIAGVPQMTFLSSYVDSLLK